MRQLGWIFALVLGVAGFLSWQSHRKHPPGTTTIDLDLPPELWATGVKFRLRNTTMIELHQGRQDLPTVAGTNELLVQCPRVAMETHLDVFEIERRSDSPGWALACTGEIDSIQCELTSGVTVTKLDLVSCHR